MVANGRAVPAYSQPCGGRDARGAILRGAWRTTLVLAVLAGVAGGLVLAGWSAVRRGATSIERFEQSVGAADLTVGTRRPAGAPTSRRASARRPTSRSPNATGSPASTGSRPPASVASSPCGTPGRSSPAEHRRRCVGDGRRYVFPTAYGLKPVVVAGRMFDRDAADEVLVSEDVVATSGITVGDTLTVRGYPISQGVDLQAGIRRASLADRGAGGWRRPLPDRPVAVAGRRGRRRAGSTPTRS